MRSGHLTISSALTPITCEPHIYQRCVSSLWVKGSGPWLRGCRPAVTPEVPSHEKQAPHAGQPRPRPLPSCSGPGLSPGVRHGRVGGCPLRACLSDISQLLATVEGRRALRSIWRVSSVAVEVWARGLLGGSRGAPLTALGVSAARPLAHPSAGASCHLHACQGRLTSLKGDTQPRNGGRGFRRNRGSVPHTADGRLRLPATSLRTKRLRRDRKQHRGVCRPLTGRTVPQ